MTKLIVLRGPSGSGKSATARILFESAPHRICLIQQDHYRFIFNPPGGGSQPNLTTIQKMITANVLTALSDGCDVILEGILSVQSYSPILDNLFTQHHGQNYMYYFDVSFEETVKRHQTKPLDKQLRFNESDMKQWYDAAHRSNHELERIVPESSSLDQTVQTIALETGLLQS